MTLRSLLCAVLMSAQVFTGAVTSYVAASLAAPTVAEAGLIRKFVATVVAATLLKMAAKGITAAVKKQITKVVVKHATDTAHLKSLVNALRQSKGDPKYGHAVDGVIDIVEGIAKSRPNAYPVTTPGALTQTLGNYWTRFTNFGKMRVYQRDSLIDPLKRDQLGMTNLERMQSGRAPIGPDGKSVQIHHMLQKDGEALAEVASNFHKQNHGSLHINPNTIPSGINRSQFEAWRESYWMSRAMDFLK